MTARTLLSQLTLHFPSASLKVSTEHTYDRLTKKFDRFCTASIVTTGTEGSPRRRKHTFTGQSYSALLALALETIPQPLA